MRFVTNLRLIPVVVIAAAALFVLKTTAIVVEGGYTLISSRTALAQGLGEGPVSNDLPPPAELNDAGAAPRGDRLPGDAARNPSGSRSGDESGSQPASWVRDIYDAPEYTGTVAAPLPASPLAATPAASAEKNAPAPAPAAPAVIDNTRPALIDNTRPAMSAGERAVLESLQQRRQELEARAREQEVRDSLLKAAEKRIEQRVQELKETEARIVGVEKKKEEEESSKFKGLVTMYENMKAKDAAKIFDRLDLRILVELVNAMNSRRMSDILGLMTPEAAERLTIEIANRSGAVGRGPTPAELPKIEGRPKS